MDSFTTRLSADVPHGTPTGHDSRDFAQVANTVHTSPIAHPEKSTCTPMTYKSPAKAKGSVHRCHSEPSAGAEA